VKRFRAPDREVLVQRVLHDVRVGGALALEVRPARYIVPAGALDTGPQAKPTRNVFFGSRAPWYAHAAELEQLEAGA
jgi:hypothetical protein